MKRLILLLVSVGMLALAGNVRAADAVFGDSLTATPTKAIAAADSITHVKRILNPVSAGSTGVLDSVQVKLSPQWQAGDKIWAVIYLNGTGMPGTRIAVSTDSGITTGTGSSLETFTLHFNGETWAGGTDSLWVGGFVKPFGGNGAKWGVTDSATAYAAYGVGWYWNVGYETVDTCKTHPPETGYDWTRGTSMSNNNKNCSWTKIFYHIAGAHTPKIDLAPDSLGFASTVDGADPASQSLYVLDTAAGDGPFSWSLTFDSSQWMSVTPTSGSVSDTVTVTLSIPPSWTDTDAGTHIDTIWVACATADSTPMPMQVVFVVSASNTPIIDVTPTSLSFSRPLGAGASPAKSLSVSNVGMGTMVWTIEHDSTWIIPVVPGDDSTGTGDLVVYWYVNPGSNPVGTYTDTLHVTCATASNTPYNIPVTMEVTAAARKLMIRKNNP